MDEMAPREGAPGMEHEVSEDALAEAAERLSRRQILRRAGIGGGVAIAGTMLASPALAQVGATDPNPSRTGRTPVGDSELATKLFVEQQRDTRVARAGDTMSGALLFDGTDAGSRRIGAAVGVDPLDFELVTGGQVRMTIAATGEVTVAGATTLSDTLSVASSATFSGPVDVSPVAPLPVGTSALSVSGPVELAETLDVTGVTSFAGKVYLAYTPSSDDEGSDPDAAELAANKGYVDATVASVRGVGARGGLDPATGVFDEVFFENDVVVRNNYTIGTRYDPTTGDLVRDEFGAPVVLEKNAVSAGPVGIADGVEVVVPAGSVWTIV